MAAWVAGLVLALDIPPSPFGGGLGGGLNKAPWSKGPDGWEDVDVTLADGEKVKARRVVEVDTSDYIWKKSALHGVLGYQNSQWPDGWPFKPEHFQRVDESDDAIFYETPRLVYHMKERLVRGLTHYYKTELKLAPGSAVLDICSSWVSHYPSSWASKEPKDAMLRMSRISGLGMNAVELGANSQLDDFAVHNLNVEDPKLPFEDETFDAVTCVGGINYLTKPVDVIREARRVLRPGGKLVLGFSNHCHSSKVVALWKMMDWLQHCVLLASYFHYAGGWSNADAFDITPKMKVRAWPAKKKKARAKAK